jgi:hypothetical protein
VVTSDAPLGEEEKAFDPQDTDEMANNIVNDAANRVMVNGYGIIYICFCFRFTFRRQSKVDEIMRRDERKICRIRIRHQDVTPTSATCSLVSVPVSCNK